MDTPTSIPFLLLALAACGGTELDAYDETEDAAWSATYLCPTIPQKAADTSRVRLVPDSTLSTLADGGQMQLFRSGSTEYAILWSARTCARLVHRETSTAWLTSSLRAALGYPIEDQVGRASLALQHGSLARGPRGWFAVTGDFDTAWKRRAACLGAPISDQARAQDGRLIRDGFRWQSFEHGSLQATTAGGVRVYCAPEEPQLRVNATDARVELIVTDRAVEESGFFVMRDRSVLVALSGAVSGTGATRTYVDRSVSNGHHCWQVTAFNAHGVRTSDTICAEVLLRTIMVPPPPPPPGGGTMPAGWDRNCGIDSCDASWHPVFYEYNPECGRSSTRNQTACQQNGAGFYQCGIGCPAGYVSALPADYSPGCDVSTFGTATPNRSYCRRM